jgi:undecaprenyl diphosphate synthase
VATPTSEEGPVDPVPAALDLTKVPVHVACVMDGNGRWATARGLPRTEGHAAGETALLDVVNGALEIGVKWITFYAFSTENWKRPPDEVRYLMGFNESLLVRRRDELNEKGVRIRFAGPSRRWWPKGSHRTRWTRRPSAAISTSPTCPIPTW